MFNGTYTTKRLHALSLTMSESAQQRTHASVCIPEVIKLHYRTRWLNGDDQDQFSDSFILVKPRRPQLVLGWATTKEDCTL